MKKAKIYSLKKDRKWPVFGKDVEKLGPSFTGGSILKYFRAETENKHVYKWTKVRMTGNFLSKMMQAIGKEILKGYR